jgi:hypothetical protein
MKRFAVIFCLLVAFSCQRQSNKTFAQLDRPVPDSTSNPKSEVHVNKKYDDKGNLIRYDSSYSYRYVSPDKIVKNIETDTLFRHFKSYYYPEWDSAFSHNFTDIFFNDTLFKYDFMQPDYFSKRFEMNRKRLENMAQHMDSLKMDYMKREYPEGEMKKK